MFQDMLRREKEEQETEVLEYVVVFEYFLGIGERICLPAEENSVGTSRENGVL